MMHLTALIIFLILLAIQRIAPILAVVPILFLFYNLRLMKWERWQKAHTVYLPLADANLSMGTT